MPTLALAHAGTAYVELYDDDADDDDARPTVSHTSADPVKVYNCADPTLANASTLGRLLATLQTHGAIEMLSDEGALARAMVPTDPASVAIREVNEMEGVSVRSDRTWSADVPAPARRDEALVSTTLASRLWK